MSARTRLHSLYEGDGRGGRVFRVALFTFDLATIAYFLVTATRSDEPRLLAVDLAVAAVIALDLAARAWIATDRPGFAVSLTALADVVVVASLVLPAVTGSNLGFLRILRVLRLVRALKLARRFHGSRMGGWINTRVFDAAANLVAFVFIVTSVVWVWEHERSGGVDTWIDALYFTVTTLTTTGYGNITLTGQAGRLINIAIMVFGVGFFLSLLQALYRPDKVDATCDDCGLALHDHDATHCKHCGHTIYIETDGDT